MVPRFKIRGGAKSMENQIFTTIGKSHSAPCHPATREEWESLRADNSLKEMCDRIKAGEDDLKHSLPVWTPHCAEFTNNHRSAADAVKPQSRLMLDFDEKGHTDEIVERLSNHSPLTVLLIEESVRKGTHVLVKLPAGMDAETAQQLMKEATGYEPDKSVKDVSRCIYMVPADHTRFVSEELFVGEEGTGAAEAAEGTGAAEANGAAGATEATGANETTETAEDTERSFKGIAYSAIIKEWWNRHGGEPQMGERNVKLHQLAVNLRSICDNRRDVLMAVMPRYGLSESELQAIVDSACKESPKGISKEIANIVDRLKAQAMTDLEYDSDMTEAKAIAWGKRLNVKKMPIGLKESFIGVPKDKYMPVACSVMPIACAYADGIKTRYGDGKMTSMGMLSMIYGEQASGKSVCRYAIDSWVAPMKEADTLARQQEDAWKEKKRCRKANEQLPPDPKVVIRYVPVTISCSTLLKRLKNSQGHTLYSFSEEIDTLIKTNSAGSWSSKYDIYRKGFDGSYWGQDYNSDQAESGNVDVYYNWTMLGTEGAVRRCFMNDNVENGLSSRMLMCKMPSNWFAKMPHYVDRTPEEEGRIREAVNILCAAQGEIFVPRLVNRMKKWGEDNRRNMEKCLDFAGDVFRKRSALIGLRCGLIYYLLEGKEKVSKECLDFAVTMADFCLEQQVIAFGHLVKKGQKDDMYMVQHTGANQNIFDELTDTFTMNDLRILKPECSDSGLRNVTSRWVKDGLIEKKDRHTWRKRTA